MSENFDHMYDMIIVGGGPAGLSAAIYMARAKYKTLVIEKERFGGQITITSEIVNYPGVFHTSGTQLTSDMQKQASSFGAEFKLAEVLDMDLSGDIKTIQTSIGEYKTLGVILALGASPRQVGFQGEQDFRGRGVAYCATCDGEFFTDLPVYVVGGGFAAVEEGLFLTKYASKVEMIVRGDDFSCAKTISDEVKENPKISVNFQTEVVSVAGENSLNQITLRNRLTNEEKSVSYENGFGVFVFAGYVPNTAWLGDKIATDKGYIITDEKQQTNVLGVYGAGDVCIKDLRQVVTAVSDGATAATSAEKYVAGLHTKLNIPPFVVAKKAPAEKVSKQSAEPSTNQTDSFIDADMREQLIGVFAKFEKKVIILGALNDSPLALEMAGLLEEIKDISEKVVCQQKSIDTSPYLEILFEDERKSGIKFFAMPGGHEFNSFILALYNVAGAGQQISPEDAKRIEALKKDVDLKVFISLSCTMCPEVVVATQKIASLNEQIQANCMDLSYFPEYKEKYHIMSVPCMIINEEAVHFGKKNITEIITILETI